MRRNRSRALILTKEGFFYNGLLCGGAFLNLKIEFVLPANTGTDGASIIRCYNGLICLQCCIHIQIHVQMHWVFCSVAQNWVKCREDEYLLGV